MNRRITQQDIAKKLGLDKSTVSIALRNQPGLSAPTYGKVRAMAEKLGYRPDPAVSMLARQRWTGHETGSGATLAYLVDSRMEHSAQHRRFLSAARARAEQRGYHVDEFDLAQYSNITGFSRILYNRGIRGVLVPQFEYISGPGILDMPADSFTIICLDLGWVKVPFHIVSPDRFEGTRLSWSQAVKRGYRRIGGAVLSHTPHALDDAARYGASCAAQWETLRDGEIIPLLSTYNRDRDSFVRWIDQHEPEVVIGFTPRVYDWIIATGRRVPDDIAFASLSVDTETYPAISGVLRKDDEVGSSGVDALIAAILENEWGVPARQRKLLLEPTWYEGSTLPQRV